MTIASHVQVSQPYPGRRRDFRAIFDQLLAQSRDFAAEEKSFSHLVLLALTALLVWLVLADAVGPSAPPLVCAGLLGFYYLSLTIRSDLAQRAAIKRRLAASRTELLRRLERL